MKTKDKSKLTRIVYEHGSEQLKAKYRKWQEGIERSPKFKDIEKISDHITKELIEKLNRAKHEKDEVKTEEIAEKIKQMRKERNRIIKMIHERNPELEQLKNEVIAEVNSIIRTYKAHRNSTHWNAEKMQERARKHISDRADDIKKFSDIESELFNFQQCIEAYNKIIQHSDLMNRTAETIAQVPFWTDKIEQYETKLDKWLKDIEKPDMIIKNMPPELFDRIRSEFAPDNWHEHEEAEKRLQEIVPFMLETVNEWQEKIARKKKRTNTDNKARSKADEPPEQQQ